MTALRLGVLFGLLMTVIAYIPPEARVVAMVVVVVWLVLRPAEEVVA